MRRLPLVLAWLALLGMVLATLAYEPAPQLPRTDTERMRVIPLDSPVSFPLDPDEEQVKLVTWLAAPARWARDVRAWSSYQLTLTALDLEQRVVWRGSTWRRTRTSWIRRRDGALLRTAWMPRSRLEVSDSRVSLVEVTGLVPLGGQLVVEGKSPIDGALVMVAAYRRAWRTGPAQLRVMASASHAGNDEAAARISTEGWEALPEAWRGRLAERLWERLSALPDATGQAERTVQILTAPAEEPWEAQPALGLPVPPGGAVAWNVQRGGTLRVTWREPSGRRPSAAPTWLQLVHADGTTEVSFLGVVQEVGPIVVDEPLLSVQVALDPGTEGPRIVQAMLAGPDPDAIWGDPALARDPEGAGWLVAPDLRSLEMTRTSPELGPVRFAVGKGASGQGGDPGESGGELLRLTVRPRLPAGLLPGFGLAWDPESNTTDEVQPEVHAPLTLEVVARDARGTELSRWQAAIPRVVSAFERYSQGDDPGTSRCTEADARFLVPPATATVLEITASAPADVALRAFHPDNPESSVARGYELPAELAPPTPPSGPQRLPTWQAGRVRASPGFRIARFEPYAQDPWRARGPLERDAMLAAGRIVRVDTQVRLEAVGAWSGPEAWLGDTPVALPEAQGPPVVATERHALDLPGPYELLVEPDRDGRSSAGTRTLLGPQATRVEVPASGRLDVDYRVPPSRAGSPLTVTIDGKPSTHPLLAAAGRLRLAGLLPGPRQVAVQDGGLFLARARGARPWQVRRVVPLAPGETWTVEVPGGPHSVAIHTYGEGGWLEWRLEGGSVSDTPAMMDRATRRFGRHRLQAEGGQARALSFGATDLARLSPLVVEIGSDVGSSPLTLQLHLAGAASPLWLRATATWARPRSVAAGRSRVVDR